MAAMTIPVVATCVEIVPSAASLLSCIDICQPREECHGVHTRRAK
jgi:hypothetical protein